MTTRNTTPAAGTAVQSGDQLGIIEFFGDDGAGFFDPGASVRAVAEENFGAGAGGSRLSFHTSPNASGSGNLVEHMRINNKGQVSINPAGLIAPVQTFGDAVVQILVDTPFWGPAFQMHGYNNNSDGPTLCISKTRNADPTLHTIVQNGDILAHLEFQGSDGTTYRRAVEINVGVDGTPGAGSMPGFVTFSTTPSGSTSPQGRLTLDSQGRVLMGPSMTDANVAASPSRVQISTDGNSSTFYWALGMNGYNAGGSHIVGSSTRGASPTTHTVLQNNDVILTINARGSDGTDYELAAQINFAIDGTPGNNDMPGRITFITTPDGSNAGAERVRIDNAGNVVVNTGALATTVTNGFLYIPTCAGTPTGVPTSYSGRVPMIFDTTAHKFWIYDSGWKGVVLS